MQRWQKLLDSFATLAIIALCSALTWTTLAQRNPQRTPPKRPDPPLPTEPISLRDTALMGDSRAAVAVLQYSDFECPYCGVFARDTLPVLEEKYVKTGKVQLAFKNFPLSIHASAVDAAKSAECARQQGKFWEMHDQFFRNQKDLSAATLRASAISSGLDAVRFDACMSSETSLQRVRSDQDEGKRLAVAGTPTFFIGTMGADRQMRTVKRLSGNQPLARFEETLDELLKRNTVASR